MTSQYVLLKTNSYIIRMNREDNLCWFHGKVSRERTEQILREEGIGDGVFLVRESNSASGDYVLSVLHHGEIWHYQIRRHGEDAFFSIDDQPKIHGLDSLIEHYQKASHGLVTRLSAIVKRDPPPNDSRSHGRTNLLHRATKEGNLIVVSELLKCGYRNLNAKNQDGQTAVHLACKFADEQIIRALLENGASVNCRDTEGNTPLHYACRNQPGAVARLLIESKANVQERNNETGCVPLHDAANHGNIDAVKELLALKAPHMPRSTYGEFPADFAREKGHQEVLEYLESFQPPPATSYKFQWYHGTLDRTEAVTILREFVQNMNLNTVKTETTEILKENNSNKTTESTENLTDDGNNDNDPTSGVFLVRFSGRNGYVLTLLHDDQPRNYIIQKAQNYLFIDEGPYMISLEHLIQHYTIFRDGLPVNLKHAVPPKPKPPIPLFSTIPKTKRPKHLENFGEQSITGAVGGVATGEQNILLRQRNENEMENSTGIFNRNKSEGNLDLGKIQLQQQSQKQQRNLSVPNDTMINKIDLNSGGTTTTEKTKVKNDILNFRSLKLKSPKRNIIIDGMKSLKRNKIKNSNKKDEKKRLSSNSNSNVGNPLGITNLMETLSFSTDFLPQQNNDYSTFYNVPTNNCSIVNIDIDEPINGTGGASKNYYTESDKNISLLQIHDKEQEEIYFIDAPTVPPTTAIPLNQTNGPNQINGNSNGNSNVATFNAAGYVVSKSIPKFFDSPQQSNSSSPTTTNNNNILPPIVPPVRWRPERLDSVMSMTSQRSDSEFSSIFLNQTSINENDELSQSSSQHQQQQQQLQNNNEKPNYFIAKDDLLLRDVLGEGEFGSVYKGVVIIRNTNNNINNDDDDSCINNEEIPVAIKTLHDEHCKENRVEFLREAKVMISLRHHCIVRLIGISKGPPLMMVQELVPLGSMLSYLQTQRDKINPNFELKVWASQIAWGMNYLESKHFVHRDLAARNILLASRNQAKISDFGLSRALGAGNDYYQASQGGKWPIKWYSPESFNFGVFSHASDVWSFGVTLWEMFSLGEPPYGDMKGVDVIKIIENGERLIKPEICPDNVFHIMQNCWNYNAKERPTFRHLTEFFSPDYQNLTELVQTEDIS